MGFISSSSNPGFPFIYTLKKNFKYSNLFEENPLSLQSYLILQNVLNQSCCREKQISQNVMVRFSSHTDSHFCSTFCKQWLCNSWDRLQHRACTSRGIHLVARYSLSHELLCIVGIHELHQKGATWLLCHGSICWVNYERRGYSLSTLPLLNQPGENTVMATVSASREVVCEVSAVILCYVCCYVAVPARRG